jgi:sulfate adenylyltransferase
MKVLPPHGGKLIDRLVPETDRARLSEEAGELTSITVSDELRKDLECIAYGIFSPLEGPLVRNDYTSVLERGRLHSDLPWTFPIVLDATEEDASKIQEGDDVALSQNETPFGVLHVEEKYSLDRRSHAESIFKTLDAVHPGVEKTERMGPVLLGGKVDIFDETPGKFPRYRLKPKETRFLFQQMGWRTIAGFQTRNAPHNGHEERRRRATSGTRSSSTPTRPSSVTTTSGTRPPSSLSKWR